MAVLPAFVVPIVRRPRGKRAYPYDKTIEKALTDPTHEPRHRRDDAEQVAS